MGWDQTLYGPISLVFVSGHRSFPRAYDTSESGEQASPRWYPTTLEENPWFSGRFVLFCHFHRPCLFFLRIAVLIVGDPSGRVQARFACGRVGKTSCLQLLRACVRATVSTTFFQVTGAIIILAFGLAHKERQYGFTWSAEPLCAFMTTVGPGVFITAFDQILKTALAAKLPTWQQICISPSLRTLRWNPSAFMGPVPASAPQPPSQSADQSSANQSSGEPPSQPRKSPSRSYSTTWPTQKGTIVTAFLLAGSKTARLVPSFVEAYHICRPEAGTALGLGFRMSSITRRLFSTTSGRIPYRGKRLCALLHQ